MIRKTEKEEKEYLAIVRRKFKDHLEEIGKTVRNFARDLYEAKKYLYENKDGMDRMEKEAVKMSVNHGAIIGDSVVAKQKRIEKLMDSPWFGRMDFREQGKKIENPIYVGVHSYYDETENVNLIHDWRAPISTMYYDFETGAAHYISPEGEVTGEITLKRQYRIRKGKMEYMVENSANIYDELLQQELSRSADDKMKNIVATIQRDQNPIVRNETSNVLIIQGVAGSGKTSIALHRIAFLLYRFKESLSARHILIISPNKVYADYIANVLPELGEEKVPETGMEELANQLLEKKVKFQSFFEQISLLTEKDDPALRERIRFKSGHTIITELDRFAVAIENDYFQPEDIFIRNSLVPAWFIDEKFKSLHRLPIHKRFPAINAAIEENIRIYYNKELTSAQKTELSKKVREMFKLTTLRLIYKEFYNWLGRPEMLKISGHKYEYSDLFPLIYLKIKLEGVTSRSDVKHLLIDEMQDYAPVQYAVLSKLFPCKKTILGDGNQTVNPDGSTTHESIAKVFPDADVVKLCRSYRSTFEITRFAQSILPDPDLIAIERHGPEPLVMQFKTENEEINEICNAIEEFKKSTHQSLAIICKTGKQMQKLYTKLSEKTDGIIVLTENSSAFGNGVVITTVHLSKGLEFDRVIVPFTTQTNYHNTHDKHLLYIACTRAMHLLQLTCVKSRTKLLIG